jgi:hypothetical protein
MAVSGIVSFVLTVKTYEHSFKLQVSWYDMMFSAFAGFLVADMHHGGLNDCWCFF